MKNSRINKRFESLNAAGRSGLVTFLTAGDPNIELSSQMLKQLPAAGADVIEWLTGQPYRHRAIGR